MNEGKMSCPTKKSRNRERGCPLLDGDLSLLSVRTVYASAARTSFGIFNAGDTCVHLSLSPRAIHFGFWSSTCLLMSRLLDRTQFFWIERSFLVCRMH